MTDGQQDEVVDRILHLCRPQRIRADGRKPGSPAGRNPAVDRTAQAPGSAIDRVLSRSE